MFGSNILKSVSPKWPVIYTDDMSDYTQIEPYKNTHPFVWLINKRFKLQVDFPLGWRPSVDESRNIHSFPRCEKLSKKPVRWDVAKLVPSNRTSDGLEIKQRTIASFDENSFQVFAYTTNEFGSDKKITKLKKDFPYCKLISKQQNMAGVYSILKHQVFSPYVWLIDLDLEFDDGFDLNFKPPSEAIYSWNTRTTASEFTYNTGALRLVPRKALRHSAFDTVVMPDTAGTLNVTSNPLDAWTRAFVEIIEMHFGIDEYVPQNIINSTCKARLRKYVNKGREDALSIISEYSSDELMSLYGDKDFQMRMFSR